MRCFTVENSDARLWVVWGSSTSWFLLEIDQTNTDCDRCMISVCIISWDVLNPFTCSDYSDSNNRQYSQVKLHVYLSMDEVNRCLPELFTGDHWVDLNTWRVHPWFNANVPTKPVDDLPRAHGNGPSIQFAYGFHCGSHRLHCSASIRAANNHGDRKKVEQA